MLAPLRARSDRPQARRRRSSQGTDIWSDPPTAVTFAIAGGAAQARGDRQARLLPHDSPTRFKGKPGTSKKVSWMRPAAPRRGQDIGRALDARSTTCCCRARRACAGISPNGRGHPRRQGLRALVPVNLRPIEEACSSAIVRPGSGLCRSASRIAIECVYAVRAAHARAQGLATSRCWPTALLAAFGMGPPSRCRTAVSDALARKKTTRHDQRARPAPSRSCSAAGTLRSRASCSGCLRPATSASA